MKLFTHSRCYMKCLRSAFIDRYWVFFQKQQKSDSLPPTSDSLQLHIKRSNYQALIWKRCLDPLQQLPSPVGNGWELEEGRLKPCLMTKGAAPQGLVELTFCKCLKSACKSSCACKSNELACTEACGCMADTCENPHTWGYNDDEEDD